MCLQLSSWQERQEPGASPKSFGAFRVEAKGRAGRDVDEGDEKGRGEGFGEGHKACRSLDSMPPWAGAEAFAGWALLARGAGAPELLRALELRRATAAELFLRWRLAAHGGRAQVRQGGFEPQDAWNATGAAAKIHLKSHSTSTWKQLKAARSGRFKAKRSP